MLNRPRKLIGEFGTGFQTQTNQSWHWSSSQINENEANLGIGSKTLQNFASGNSGSFKINEVPRL
jgi:hypothetical protein